jgi:nitrite reductase/ring-hydroxylating ferredoxin subunit
MGFFKRLLGISATRQPADMGCWQYVKGEITIDLSRAPELTLKGTAIRLEGRHLPVRILVVHGEDGIFYAFKNKCTHSGRRIDLLSGNKQLQCCSVSKSTFDYEGKKVAGPAKGPLVKLKTEVKDGKVVISSS